MSDYCLGLLPARPGAIQLKLTEFADLSKWPQPPVRFGHGLGLVYGILGNASVGDCVIAGGMHEEMTWGSERGKIPPFTAACAIRQYTEITGYDPRDPRTDRGTDMQVAASFRRRTGLRDANGVRHKILAYLGVDYHNTDHLIVAAYALGAIGIGAYITQAAMTQFANGQPWTVVPSSPVKGAHYIPIIGRNSHGNPLIVTWGRVHAVTPEWLSYYTEQAVANISPVPFGPDGKTLEGFNLADLQHVLAGL